MVLIATVPAASVVTDNNGCALPPTTPPKVVVPLSFTANAYAVVGDSIVELNVTPTPVKIVVAPNVTASLYVCVPLVVIMPPLMAVVPPVLVVTLAA